MIKLKVSLKKINVSLKKMKFFLRTVKKLSFNRMYNYFLFFDSKKSKFLIKLFNLLLNNINFSFDIKEIVIDYLYANKSTSTKKIIYLARGKTSFLKRSRCNLFLSVYVWEKK